MDDVRRALEAIEADIDGETYRPGPWGALVRDLRGRSRAERSTLSADVSRVSEKLHRMGGRPTLGLAGSIALELLAAFVGVVLLTLGLDAESNSAVIVAAVVLATALQPLVKIAIGGLLGVRYSYAYLYGFEPRFKMRYGTYLAAAAWQRGVPRRHGRLAAGVVGRRRSGGDASSACVERVQRALLGGSGAAGGSVLRCAHRPPASRTDPGAEYERRQRGARAS